MIRAGRSAPRDLDIQVNLNVYGGGMRIKEVADRSGFTPPTLRYYEEIGLLPPAVRTASGYRSYDSTTLDRLRFIGRAKQLGCTLEEIAELTVAWEGGTCGPVQGRLRAVVADKLAETQHQILELTTWTTELRTAAELLDRHRPDGPCDTRCGCLSVPDALEETPVTAATAPSGPEPTIVCTLQASDVRTRLDDWQKVLARANGRSALAGGIRVELPDDISLAELTRLAKAEQTCCQFLSFSITIDNRGIGLEVTSSPAADTVIAALFGTV